MPVKWSVAEVSQAMEEIEKLLDQAQPYLDEVKEKAEAARKILHLPGYIDQRLIGLIFDIERFTERAKSDIAWVRKDIPEQSLKAPASKSLFD